MYSSILYHVTWKQEHHPKWQRIFLNLPDHNNRQNRLMLSNRHDR